MKVVFPCLLAVGAVALSENAANRPVSKVLTLLKDMSDTLEKDAAKDQAIYDKMVCWCTTNDAAKVTSIADAETHIKNLGTKIEELTALSAQLNEEINTLSAEVAKNQKALKTATTMREEELAAFGEEESATMDSISSLGGALDAPEASGFIVRTGGLGLEARHSEACRPFADGALALGARCCRSLHRFGRPWLLHPDLGRRGCGAW